MPPKKNGRGGNGGRGRNRTADTGIFNLNRKFKKINLSQPLAAFAKILQRI
jgi:hypothetical protein